MTTNDHAPLHTPIAVCSLTIDSHLNNKIPFNHNDHYLTIFDHQLNLKDNLYLLTTMIEWLPLPGCILWSVTNTWISTLTVESPIYWWHLFHVSGYYGNLWLSLVIIGYRWLSLVIIITIRHLWPIKLLPFEGNNVGYSTLERTLWQRVMTPDDNFVLFECTDVAQYSQWLSSCDTCRYRWQRRTII